MNNLGNVTSERLQKIASWRETYGADSNVMIPADEAALIVSELMAFREAAEKPVAVVEYSDYITAAQMVGDEPRRKAVKELYEDALVVGQSLFTAPQPPAEPVSQPYKLPVVPDERAAFESFMSERFGDSIDIRRAKNGDNEYMAWDVAVAWIVWQRRAMLQSQPQNAQQNIPENIPEAWISAINRLLDSDGSRGCFSATQCYDAHKEIEAMLAAAPKPGVK